MAPGPRALGSPLVAHTSTHAMMAPSLFSHPQEGLGPGPPGKGSQVPIRLRTDDADLKGAASRRPYKWAVGLQWGGPMCKEHPRNAACLAQLQEATGATVHTHAQLLRRGRTGRSREWARRGRPQHTRLSRPVQNWSGGHTRTQHQLPRTAGREGQTQQPGGRKGS